MHYRTSQTAIDEIGGPISSGRAISARSPTDSVTHVATGQAIKSKVLIVYERIEPPIVLQAYLQTGQLNVELVPHQSTAYREIERLRPQLVVLDSGEDLTASLNLCRTICLEPKTASIPVVILSQSQDETDEIVAFKMGASDYITKPFRVKPVIQRLQSLLRRGVHVSSLPEVVHVAGMTLHRLYKVVEIDGQKLQLTSTEYDILELLTSRPGYPFHRREILNFCRGLSHKSSERTIDVHIRNLREKLRNFDLIQTQRGMGYSIKTAKPSRHS